MVAAGRIAGLSGSAATVYIVLCAHADREWVSRPGVNLIAERLKPTDGRTVERALSELQRLGLIRLAARGGGRKHKAAWRIITNPDETTGESERETPAVSSANPGGLIQETPAVSSTNPGGFVPQENRGEQSIEQQQQQSAAAAAGCAPKDSGPETDQAVVGALIEAGIGGKKRHELAQLWTGIDGAAGKIKATAARLAGRGKSAAIIIGELAAQAEAERAKADRERTDNQARARARQLAKAREAELSARQEAGRVWWGSLSEQERGSWRRKWLEHPKGGKAQPVLLRRRMPNPERDPKTFDTLYLDDLIRLFGPTPPAAAGSKHLTIKLLRKAGNSA